MKRYTKDSDYSYTLGVFPTIELLMEKPESVVCIYLSSKANKNSGTPKILSLADQYQVKVVEDDKMINKLSKKDNCYAIAVFNKFEETIDKNTHHVVLVNPSDMGNIGTIIRTMIGFGFNDLILIRPAVDVYDPRSIRASMGALFKIRFHYYDCFEDYLKDCPNHHIYTLMLQGAKNIHQLNKTTSLYSLVFGNESSGLPEVFLNYGESIYIPHLNTIDSLNLSQALGITLYEFSRNNFEKGL